MTEERAGFSRLVIRPLLLTATVAMFGAIVGVLLQMQPLAQPVQSAGQVLFQVSAWIAVACLLLTGVALVAQEIVMRSFVGVARLLELLGSGGLLLLVNVKPPRLSAPTRSLLRIVASGGLALLVSDASQVKPHRRDR